MGLLSKLFGNKCINCNSKLFLPKPDEKRVVGIGMAAIEEYIDKRDRFAYTCNNCGANICYSCASNYSCPKCGGQTFNPKDF